jgi:hypothetical protein
MASSPPLSLVKPQAGRGALGHYEGGDVRLKLIHGPHQSLFIFPLRLFDVVRDLLSDGVTGIHFRDQLGILAAAPVF